MGTRTVRLDDEAENALHEIRRVTGMSISEALKRGLLLLSERVGEEAPPDAWAIYERLDLGPGGYAGARSTGRKAAVRETIRRKHGR